MAVVKRFLIDVQYSGSFEMKTYSFSTWDQRSTMIRQLPKGTKICAYECGRRHERLTDEQISEIRNQEQSK